MPETKQNKVYSLREVVTMLPLVQRICADFESSMVEVKRLTENDERLDDNDVEFYLRQRANRHEDLKQEIAQLKGKICHAGHGFIDLPVWHPHLTEVVHVCVSARSEAARLKAHLTIQKAEYRKFFWFL